MRQFNCSRTPFQVDSCTTWNKVNGISEKYELIAIKICLRIDKSVLCQVSVRPLAAVDVSAVLLRK
jgi:hypothetical protein